MQFHAPQIPIVGNCNAQPLNTADEVKRELITQICGCVQWKRTVDYMVDSGVNEFIEVGPGKALSGMVKRISRRSQITAVGDMESILNLGRN